ncbi:hypothetical protein PybrP1_010038 [[Pythium] brassicae (nom. inval.)]|nr:hypothetical protein PybrP1_010038 [[Pythium] brassicae (nom. inval.)]
MPSRLLLVLALVLAAGMSISSATDTFAGDFKRTSISPRECVDASSCDYLCAASYTITVQRSTATIYPTANPPDCACKTLTARISGDTATGSSSDLKFSLTLTANGINAVSSASGLTCTAKYTASATTPIDSQVAVGSPSTAVGVVSSDATLSTHARPEHFRWMTVLSAVLAVFNM